MQERQRTTPAPRSAARAWLAVMMAGSVATAQPAIEGPKGAMPDETWGVVMVDQGTRWRSHEPTRRLMQWAVKSGLFAESQAAWDELAGSMGLEGQAAFDALLGEHAMLVLGEPKPNAVPAWGVTTCVTPQNGTTLERGLDAAPRGFEQGRPVMLVERGKYRLSKLDRRDGIEEIDGWNRMLLSPVTASENPGWIAKTIGVAEGLTRSPGEITWYQKVDAKGAYVLTSVAQEERGWRAKIRATPGVLGLTDAACQALSKSEPVAVVASRPEVLIELSGYLPSQASDLAAPSKELGLLLAAARVTAPSPQWSGDRVLIRVERTSRNDEASGFVVLVACEVKDRRAAATWFDGLISGVLEVAGQIQGTGGQAAADLRRDIKLAGNEPSATRLVVLGGANRRDHPAAKLAGADHGTLAWTTVGDGQGGWWVMQYRVGLPDREAAERSLRTAGAEVASTRWGNHVVSLKARPAELWKAAGVAGLGVDQGLIGLAAELETVEVVMRATPQGLEGEAVGKMTEPTPVTPAAK